MNKLNRSLEGVIAVGSITMSILGGNADGGIQVGNEFSSVEALWSQFEGVMAKDPDAETEEQKDDDKDGDEHEGASSEDDTRR
jgi:DASH complex subunit DAD1